jgi:hypothetical protein
MSAMDVPAEGTAGRADEKAVARSKAVTYISWIALALMATSSVASLRPAPTIAVYGLACIFLYIVPAIIFLLPTSLVSAELASGYEGGVYNRVARGISKPMGFLAVWCQFAMTIFYYPTLLGFVASTLAYVINPELASSGVWTAIVIVVVYWTGVWVSSRGTKGIAGLASGGLIIGTLIPGAVLVILGVVFLGQGNPSAAPMTAGNLLPAWAGLASLVLIGRVCGCGSVAAWQVLRGRLLRRTSCRDRRWQPSRRRSRPGSSATAPTVLLYSHYDVQPPLDEAAWRAPPFQLTEVDGSWYGRGAADCKGNIVAHLMALRALGDDVPVNLKLVFEGSEEQGRAAWRTSCRRTQICCARTRSSSATPATQPSVIRRRR